MSKQQFKQSKNEPFLIVKQGKKYQIAVGNNLVSHKTFDEIEQAEMYISTKPYELIINTCLCMFYQIQKENEKDTNETAKNAETNDSSTEKN